MTVIRGFFLSCFATCALGLAAQERERPAIRQELWTSFALEGRPYILEGLLDKDLIKRIRTTGTVGYRSADSFFAGRQVYVEGAADYKVSDHVKLGGEFRYAYRSNDPDRQRICAEFQYRTEVDRLELGYAFTFQHTFLDMGEQREVLRNKFGAGYNIPKFKFDPKASVEFFQWAGYQGLLYFGTRYKLGTEWSPRKGHTLGLAVIHDRQRAIYAPEYRFIASVDYTINLRKN